MEKLQKTEDSRGDIPLYPPRRDRNKPLDPPPDVLAWAAETPVRRVRIWNDVEAWLVTGYAEAKAVLGDNRFSAVPTNPGFPEKNEAFEATLGQDRNLRTLDDPEHAAQKRMIIQDFTVKRVEGLRQAIQAKVDALIDQMLSAGPTADIVKDLALPVPTMVICELQGVPYADREFFVERSNTVASARATRDEARAAAAELYDYMDRLIDEKDRNPGNDLLSRLVVEQLRTGSMSRKELIELSRFILVAGHETTANMISLSVLALLQNPDQLQVLNADPAVLNNAVDELLRYLSIVHTGRRRAAIADVEIGGQLIRAGEGVIVANNIADRDENTFADAHRLDLRRENARANMAFGHGIHQCLGQMLSRVELQIIHGTLWRRIPDLALAVPLDALRFKEGGPVYGVKALPVRWG